jgi:proline iminopeptidase
MPNMTSTSTTGTRATQHEQTGRARDPGDPRGPGAWRRWPVVPDRRTGTAVAAVVVAAYAGVLGLLLPRGPVTTAQALVALGVGVVAGVLAGTAMRSRWAALLAPVVFAAVFEVARLDASGPTVDGLQLTSTYGAIALVVGRGFLGLLTLAPLALGAVLGAAAARRAAGPAPHRSGWRRLGLQLRRTVTVAIVLGLAVFATALARPGQTDPILGPDGEPLPGSIAELTRVEIDGHDLGLMIRGHDVDDPVLLFLAGGPGGSELGAMRRHASALEEDFVVATFDQRGTGRSHDELEPIDTLTLDRAVADVIEVTDYLRERFDEDQVFLVGQSWGSTLGVLAAQQRPELFTALVGVGQMVDQRETDQLIYRDMLDWAREQGDDDLVAELVEIGEPPYEDAIHYETVLSQPDAVYPYDHGVNSEGAGGFSENILVEEYTLLEQVHILGAMMDVFDVLYPQLQDIDFRESATRLDVPVYLVQGAHEVPGRARLAEQWFDALQAPHKELFLLDTSGHRPIFEQPDRFHEVMTDHVLADAEAAS